MESYRVGILGATGAVGQQFISLLAEHPWFTVTAVAASERSVGKAYREAVNWVGEKPLPPDVAELEVQSAAPDLPCDFVFSGLDARAAGDIEAEFARAGYPVVSNARNYRMQPDVPLLIPDVNPEHADLVSRQDWGSAGYIVTNPNCATVGLVCALKPIHEAFGVEKVQVSTMQAISGAGYPGVASLDILGNVIPYIGGEEDKLETEPLKILGTLEPEGVVPAAMTISAQCNRVPVIDGHTETVSVKLGQPASPEEVVEVLRAYRSPLSEMSLPTQPVSSLAVFDEPHLPQPRRQAWLGGGMTVSVGRVRACPVLDIKFVTLSHNTVRGAAGGAILNAELLAHREMIARRVGL